MAFDPIGLFQGKLISEMNREELLEFAKYAGKRICELEEIERSTQDFRINEEITKQPK